MNKIPCAVIKDLMPSYVDELTSEESGALIREHLEGCEDCRKALAAMQGQEEETPEAASEDKKEIDFLKKNRKRNLAILWGSLAGALVLVAVVVFVRLYLVGNRMSADSMAVQTRVEGDKMIVDGTITDSIHGAGNPSVVVKDGEAQIYVNEVLASPATGHSFEVVLEDSDNIRLVRLNDRTVWMDGQRISGNVSALYESRHDYMGDPSANNRTANALHLAEIFGPYKNELLSAEKPLTWKLCLSEDISEDKAEYLENKMRQNGYLILSVIGNLDAVCYEYTVGGQERVMTCNASDVTAFLGKDCKGCMQDVGLLQELYDSVCD